MFWDWGFDSCASGCATVVCCCEHDNVLSGSIKGCEFADHQNDYHLFKKDFAP